MSATITAFPTTSSRLSAPSAPAVREAAVAAMPAGRTRLRITRRGQAVLTVLVAVPLLAVLAIFLMGGGGAAATSTPGDVHFQHVTISSGETLWQVAETVAPKADPRDVIVDITKLNNLSSTDLQPGQTLAIPLQYSH
ncbi:LysM peptidoglycan-binding domain-containing protein [Frondihabitans cladoniiphilus]|uniref:LysM domain-containing protein n=1 Tax=Frondihabitans cladoniiphilus TaxID=715785 RepID=A0ABP8VQW1_9MICO